MRQASITLFLLLAGCASGGSLDAGGGGRVDAGGGGGFDAGEMGFDAGGPIGFDAGEPGFDAGGPIGFDAGEMMMGVDAGTVGLIDAGFDAATPDAGFDASLPDAGSMMGGSLALTPGFTTVLAGDTTSPGTTWHRPVAGTCPAGSLSAVATAVPYETRLVHNASTGTLSVTVETTAAYDGYLVIYLGTAIPSDPLMCHEGDDDSGVGIGDPLLTFPLNAGQSAVIVATGFDNTDAGPYTMAIDAI